MRAAPLDLSCCVCWHLLIRATSRQDSLANHAHTRQHLKAIKHMSIAAAAHLVPQDVQLCHRGDIVAAGHRLTRIIDHHHCGIGVRAVEHDSLARTANAGCGWGQQPTPRAIQCTSQKTCCCTVHAPWQHGCHQGRGGGGCVLC